MLKFVVLAAVILLVRGFLLDNNGQLQSGTQSYLSISKYVDEKTTQMHHELEKLRSDNNLAMNLLTSQLKERLSKMEQDISRTPNINETCQPLTDALEQKYRELEENNTKMGQTIEAIQAKYDALYETLQNKSDQLQLKVNELQKLKSIKQLDSFRNLQSKVGMIDSSVTSLLSHEQARNEDFMALRNISIESRHRMDELQREVIRDFNFQLGLQNMTLSKIQQEMEQDHQKYVFFAVLTDNAPDLPVHNIIIFNAVKLNVGGSYDITTGIFTCPVDGYYLLSWTTSTSNPNNIYSMALVVDGNTVAAQPFPTSSMTYTSRSTSVVVQMQTGQKAWIQTDGVNGISLIPKWYNKDITFFCGFKI